MKNFFIILKFYWNLSEFSACFRSLSSGISILISISWRFWINFTDGKWLFVVKCADDMIICDQIRQSGGITTLVSILSSKPKFDIILPVTGAIWKLCRSRENVEQFQKLNIIDLLIPLMHTQPEKVNRCHVYRILVTDYFLLLLVIGF